MENDVASSAGGAAFFAGLSDESPTRKRETSASFNRWETAG